MEKGDGRAWGCSSPKRKGVGGCSPLREINFRVFLSLEFFVCIFFCHLSFGSSRLYL